MLILGLTLILGVTLTEMLKSHVGSSGSKQEVE